MVEWYFVSCRVCFLRISDLNLRKSKIPDKIVPGRDIDCAKEGLVR